MKSNEISLRYIIGVCIATCTFLNLHIGFCTAYTVVYAFNHISAHQNAILKIILGFVSFFVVALGLFDEIRGWIVNHYKFFAFCGIIIDGSTELLLLTDPMIKMVCDVVALSSFFKLYRIQVEERNNAIFNREELKNTRAKFNAGTDMGAYGGLAFGGLIAYVFSEIPIEIIIWVSAIWASLTYVASALRFSIMDKYIQQNNLLYPYQKEEIEKASKSSESQD